MDRRNFFGLAAAISVAVSPVAVMATPAEADSALIALGARYDALWASYNDATATRKRVLVDYYRQRDLRSPACRITKDDVRYLGSVGLGMPTDFISEHEAVRAQKWLDTPWLRNEAAQKAYEVRAREMVAAFEADIEEERRVAERTGLRAASDREDELYDLVEDIQADILSAPCSTLQGLLVKARAADRMRPPPSIGMDRSEDAAFSVIDTLLAMELN